ncbi:dihydrofolate reductase [Sutcliffiella deserti]|uniref:dihydrofolate reductase n=1 Tax=Sutcliffiella deserti TaxID=2875501 RepID=UPI001CBAA1FB|nr:dihydrofolate reductase [Sutcliffiella deserti]
MISVIVATDRNGLIGNGNKMPWRIPADLAYFKRVTTGSTVVMGRKTFESIGKPLPNRKNIILTRDSRVMIDGCETVTSMDMLKDWISIEEEIFVMGGGEIYKQALPFANTLYLTYIDEEFDGDTYFPSLVNGEWELLSSEKGVKNESNPYDYYFKVYKRVESTA